MDDRLPPASSGLRLSEGTLVRDDGRVIVGGTPTRLLRLSTSGARTVSLWAAGRAIGAGTSRRSLARRLLDAGLAVAEPAARRTLHDLAVVVPVRERADHLERCLASVRRCAPEVELIVVDDGSTVAAQAIAASTARHDAKLLRHVRPLGPAAARNDGVTATRRPLIAFIDADVVLEEHCLERLAAHLEDPCVGAAAPRVLGLTDLGWIGGYEARHSSLDMGTTPAAVGPGRPVPYVPSATLVVRRDALPHGMFDETLTVGEDVDLIWRMHGAGHRVVYDPAATVRHDHRTRPRAFVRRRWEYARSLGPLARRHPGAVPAFRADPLTALTVGALVARRPVLAAALVALRGARLRRAVAPHVDAPTPVAAALTVDWVHTALRGGSHAVRRAWSPLLLLIGRRRAVELLLAAYVIRMSEPGAPRRPHDAALELVADAAAAIGTWAGCLEHLTVRPLGVALRSVDSGKLAHLPGHRGPLGP